MNNVAPRKYVFEGSDGYWADLAPNRPLCAFMTSPPPPVVAATMNVPTAAEMFPVFSVGREHGCSTPWPRGSAAAAAASACYCDALAPGQLICQPCGMANELDTYNTLLGAKVDLWPRVPSAASPDSPLVPRAPPSSPATPPRPEPSHLPPPLALTHAAVNHSMYAAGLITDLPTTPPRIRYQAIAMHDRPTPAQAAAATAVANIRLDPRLPRHRLHDPSVDPVANEAKRQHAVNERVVQLRRRMAPRQLFPEPAAAAAAAVDRK